MAGVDEAAEVMRSMGYRESILFACEASCMPEDVNVACVCLVECLKYYGVAEGDAELVARVYGCRSSSSA